MGTPSARTLRHCFYDEAPSKYIFIARSALGIEGTRWAELMAECRSLTQSGVVGLCLLSLCRSLFFGERLPRSVCSLLFDEAKLSRICVGARYIVSWRPNLEMLCPPS